VQEAQPDLQLMARAAGDIHGRVVRQRLREHQSAGSTAEAMRAGLMQLQYAGLITPSEVRLLGGMVDAITGDIPLAAKVWEVHAVYDALMQDPSASPVATGIASVASNSIQTAAAEPTEPSPPGGGGPPPGGGGNGGRSDEPVVVIADVNGAIGGAQVGAQIAGPLDGGIGALLGMLAGASMASAAVMIAMGRRKAPSR
jgi:hypothetical protein